MEDVDEVGNFKNHLVGTSSPIAKKKYMYNESYLRYGFTFFTCHEGVSLPLCLICSETLAAESMKPTKLARHFHTKHAAFSKKPIEYFQRLLSSSKQSKSLLEKYSITSEKYQLASYEAPYTYEVQ